MNSFLIYLIFIIYFIKKCVTLSKRYITIPFNIQKERLYSSNQYNYKIFIQNNFYKNITYSFYVGKPPKKVDGIIINDNLCFEMKLLKDLDIHKNYIESNDDKYKPKDSSSFSLSHNELRWNKGQYMTIGSDIFNFDENKSSNLSFLFKKSKKDIIDLNGIKNEDYIIKFNLNVQGSFSGDECPNFMYYVRAKAVLSKYLISYIFKNSNEGLLIIGDDLFNYNPKMFNESYYTGVYTFNYNSLNHDEEIIIDSINNQNISLNKSDAFIYYNYGIIIGTNPYKEYIHENFFRKLISENICSIELINFNDTTGYYIYTCKNSLNLDNFPKLIFFSRSYKYNFEMNYNDLFTKKFDNNIYFLVLFRVNKNIKDDWILGEPFYRKYTFSFNLDSKIVGFYNKIFHIENINEEDVTDDKKNNQIKWIILLSILGLILLVLLMYLSFYYGMKLKEGRKKRANELKEDNYEYFPEFEKEDNKLIN